MGLLCNEINDFFINWKLNIWFFSYIVKRKHVIVIFVIEFLRNINKNNFSQGWKKISQNVYQIFENFFQLCLK